MAEAAAVVGAIGTAIAVPAASRSALLGGVCLLLAAVVGLAFAGDQAGAIADLLGSAPGLAAVAAGVSLVGLAAAALVRWPGTTTPALLAVAPIRLPIATDPDSPVLLEVAGPGGLGRPYPLYLLLGAAVTALLWRSLRRHRAGRRRRSPGGAGRRGVAAALGAAPVPRALALPLAAFAALAIGSFLWSVDQPAARADLLFTWLPLVLLFVVVARAPVSPRTLAIVLVGIAAAFAAVAIVQAATERLLFYTVSLEQANELGELFRVTAAFQDPNHLGRHLVLALALVLAAAWAARIRPWPALALVALLGTGLWFTYSQSSLATLAVVALAVALAVTRGRPRLVLAAVAATALAAGLAGLALSLAGGSAADVTSERSTLLADTAAVAARHPFVGVGISGQPRATRDELAPEQSKLQSVSHTTPLTVAAELGVLGVFALLALVAGVVRVLSELARRRPTLGLSLAAVLLALLLHSLFYAGLFENPLTWGALGVAAATARERSLGGPSVAALQRSALRSWAGRRWARTSGPA